MHTALFGRFSLCMLRQGRQPQIYRAGINVCANILMHLTEANYVKFIGKNLASLGAK